MTGSVAIDVVIGLVFIYLLYSLLVTIVGEMIGTWLGIRARNLRMAIERMLNDSEEEHGSIAAKLWRRFLAFFLYEPASFPKSFAGRFYDHPSIKYLSRSSKQFSFSFRHGKPAYITKEKFSDTLIFLFRSKGKGQTDLEKIKYALTYNTLHIQPETISYFEIMVADASGDFQKFRERLQTWYEESVDEALGWYKRKMQFLLFWIGFIIVAFFNVDTIKIVSKLSKDTEARRQLTDMGISATNKKDDPSGQQDTTLSKKYKEVKQGIDSANLILGLGWENVKSDQVRFFGLSPVTIYRPFNPIKVEFWGLILTALALSLGAPFWFGLLKNLAELRGAGVNPDEKEKPVTRDQGNVKTPGEDIQWPPAVAEEAKSEFDVELIRLRNLTAGLHGVISVEKGFTKKEGTKIRAIEIHIKDESVRKTLEGKIKEGSVPLQYFVNQEAAAHGVFPGDAIYNRLDINGKGTLGCFATRKDSRKKYIISCWHVLKGDRNWYSQSGPKVIFNKDGKAVGTLVDGTLADDFDAGFAEINTDETVSNTQAGIKFNFRSVTEDDAMDEIPVRFRGKTAHIHNNEVEKALKYSDGFKRTVGDLFSITRHDDHGKLLPPSVGGDSGAVVVDEKGYPLGIVIGGDASFTYVSKFSNILSRDSIYSEYSILIT